MSAAIRQTKADPRDAVLLRVEPAGRPPLHHIAAPALSGRVVVAAAPPSKGRSPWETAQSQTLPTRSEA